MAGIYVGLFILGFYLDNYGIRKIYRIILYLSAIISTVLTICLTNHLSVNGKIDIFFYGNGSITTIITASALFIFFKHNYNKEFKIISILSEKTFGIYLIHAFILDSFKSDISGLNLYKNIVSSSIGILDIVLYVYFMSYVIIAITIKVKVINRLVMKAIIY